ncbi:retron St85 family RNA-directed DNA polymerase [Chloroflexota bacterium]
MQKKKLENNWIKYLKDTGIKKTIVSKYARYITRIIDHEYPVIFEFNHLAALLGRTNEYLASVVNSPENHYRIYNIPKRSGGYREISAPYPALLECQQWINKYILSKIKVHEKANGFVHGKSIITNAEKHLGKKCLLKIDLENYFPSIGIEKVINIFMECGYPHNVSFYLARICCLDERLPQGAATSPSLSNIISYGLDSRLNGLAKKFGIAYTRYADDLTFSGDRISIKTLEIIKGIIEGQGFKVNERKTHLCRSKGKRIVTGISVADDKLRIPRPYRRKLRQELYYILNYGYISHAKHKEIGEPFHLDSLYGKLNFWKLVEPNNQYVHQAIDRIKTLRIKV